MDEERRKSLRLKISMAKEMLANLPADLPRRDVVVAAMKGVIADAEQDLAAAGPDETPRG